MTRTFILLCTGVFAIAYALYELKHMGVYYPDASNPQLFTGWKAVTELGPAIPATGIAATAFSLWLFILFFRGSESRRIQSETDRYKQALREAEEAHRARQNTLIQNHNLRQRPCEATTVVLRMYCGKRLHKKKASCFRRCRMPERSQAGAGRTEGGTESARIHPAEKKELALKQPWRRPGNMWPGSGITPCWPVWKQRKQRKDGEMPARRRNGADGNWKKLQTTDGTAGQKH